MNRRGGYWKNLAIALDQSIGAIFGIPADLTISAYVSYKRICGNGAWYWTMCEAAIDGIFGKNHCRESLNGEWDVIRRYYGDNQ